MKRAFAILLLTMLLSPAQLALSGESGEGTDRYRPCDPASLVVPRRPVTRRDYVDYVRPYAQGFEVGPDRAQYVSVKESSSAGLTKLRSAWLRIGSHVARARRR